MFTGKVSKYALNIAVALLAFFLGNNYQDIIYFNDDNDIKNVIYNDAVKALTMGADGKISASARKSLMSEKTDYFRTKSIDCVRFMPIKSVQEFVITYCKSRINNEVYITRY
jgi:hypothetical protein